ncbi:hypothetical protein NC653_030551 [Populus alba x Populus x berolinensis]|uniref:Uncharacterized protein n=1 Tax=Populus alba x Populus x berolinensis TaxID=444605 RepID=A0AAD6LWB9_9ROSI|nr:hypothetical protein NC653_030551 [Populus alba x Populus x berolinensis]
MSQAFQLVVLQGICKDSKHFLPLAIQSMASFVTSGILPCFGLNSDIKPRFQARVQSSASVALKLGRLKPSIDVNDFGPKDLESLWDDGYGTKTVKDYFDGAKEMIRPDGGPPPWFCPIECRQPLKSSPTLLFLPGVCC